MTKLYTHTEEIEHCGGCVVCIGIMDEEWRCDHTKSKRVIKDMWGEIPKFCPLPEKKKK